MALVIEIKRSIFCKQVAQRSRYLTEVLDESCVEPNMSEKRPNLFHCLRGWNVGDLIHLGFINLNTYVGNNMPQNNPLFYH
jgi:hypothetical protein